ncbi:GerAB/ArcD/ProY family transporter [Anaerobacillus sp. CMMVII]|uniref:GerAB/ArcD/ProY family transporter n=1 Tax=Anaerobacillus sp. CMMVII TaxID=2755588 RepID=UPI0021B716F1|nr:spore germination protein [Anaerobacillus sp. CMMVII]MCT8137962.1 GerAB/ArcD/ProY family transporter [Anaerobacillus sp. CMMVII]
MKEKIHYTQLAVTVYMIQSGVILFALPRLVAEAFGTNGWLGVLILSSIVLVNLYLIILVYKKGNGQSVFAILEASLPKILLYPLYLYIIISCGLLGVFVAKNYTLLIQLTMFPEVNPNHLLFLFLIVAMYFVSKGIYNMAKITVICFLYTIWTTFLLLIVIEEFSFLRMTSFLLQNATDPIGMGLEAYSAFLGFELVLFMFPYLQRDGTFGKAIVVGHLFTTFIYTVVCYVAMGFFSFEQLTNILYPVQVILKFMETPMIERIENFVFAIFLLKILVTVVFYHWVALEVTKQFFKKAKESKLISFLFLGTFLVAIIPTIQREVNEIFAMVVNPYIVFTFCFPLLLLFLLWIQAKKARRQKDVA